MSSHKECKHSTNVHITESVYEYITHTFTRGGITHFYDTGYATNRIRVTCDTCGFDESYLRSELPQWVQNLLDLFYAHGVENIYAHGGGKTEL